MVMNLDKYQSKLSEVTLMPFCGKVVRVTGLTVESKGPPVGVGQLCEIRLSNGRRILAEVVGFQNEHRVLLPLEGVDGIALNDRVIAHSASRHIALSSSLLGRVLDGLGRPMDGKGSIEPQEMRSLDRASPPPLTRKPITEPLPLGIRAIDGMLTCGKGQRVGIFAGSGVGKSTLLGEIARSSSAEVNVLALVGERGREVRAFMEESLGEEGLARSVVVVATADASPLQRVKAAFTAITIAEYFRDQGKDVLFMMDSLTRFAHAQREIGLATGEPPTTKGYCPSVFSLLPKLTERLGCAEHGSITGMFAILVDGDDMNDPLADAARSLLDGHFVLSRRLAEQGHYPAIDILQSVSRLMPSVASKAHLRSARSFRAIYSTYLGAEDLIHIGAFQSGSNPRIDRAITLIDRLNEFLIQSVNAPSTFDKTVAQLMEITQTWDSLMPTDDDPAATSRVSG
jgi:flagellum-specific ATP synthase